ncbi:MAG TPA: OB-fold domain-containing protein [Caulobacteraceae bacterium]|jgi:uncharacterized OB-fold protein
MASRPLAEGLFRVVDGAPRLLGGRRKSDGKFAFPMPQDAQAELYEVVELAAEGRLWSYTVQRFRPKTPYAGPGDDRSFRPYAVGYVELPGQIIVESHLKADDFAALKIGMPMRLALIPFAEDPDGTQVLTYAFEASHSHQQAEMTS